ncbi:neutral zinc metallopeptidase [Marinactinospora rubrisoli]|uniref:Neutral zinc metallopeptidase n=1 Tax=Marinactinospora rubrisoli TaxID=2715399 RepID=A0ABW2KAV7_9ACTN
MGSGYGECERRGGLRPASRRARRGPGALYWAIGAAALALAVLVWSVRAADEEESGVSGVAAHSTSAPDPTASGADADEAPVRPSGEHALLANPLYETGRLAPLPCPAPELTASDPASMERFLSTVADCLDEAWQTQFDRAGIPFDPPNRVFWSEPGSSPCRDYPSTAGAFYCRASKSIYIGTSDVVDKWNGAEDSVVYASLLAHEYAHHVQGESGLLDYYHDQRRREPDVPAQNAWTRRSELQANCLAGAFLGAVAVSYPVTESDRRTVREDAAATADREDSTDAERTHGSAANSVLWIEHGMERQDPGACNTWGADAELVQ